MTTRTEEQQRLLAAVNGAGRERGADLSEIRFSRFEGRMMIIEAILEDGHRFEISFDWQLVGLDAVGALPAPNGLH